MEVALHLHRMGLEGRTVLYGYELYGDGTSFRLMEVDMARADALEMARSRDAMQRRLAIEAAAREHERKQRQWERSMQTFPNRKSLWDQ